MLHNFVSYNSFVWHYARYASENYIVLNECFSNNLRDIVVEKNIFNACLRLVKEYFSDFNLNVICFLQAFKPQRIVSLHDCHI